MPKKGGGGKVVAKTVKDPEMIRIFNQMMGNDDPEPEIIMPKYDRIVDKCECLVQMLTKLCESPCAKKVFLNEAYGFSEVSRFVEECNKFISEQVLEKIVYTPPSERRKKPTIEDLARQGSRPMYDHTLICEAYKNIKNSRMVQEFLRTYAILSRFKNDVLDPKCTGDFIIEQPGADLGLFSFATSLNFKAMFISDEIEQYKGANKYLLTFLRIFTKKLNQLYDVITEPDIDVDKFSEMLTRNISKVRGQIPGCDKAFDKIVNSIGLLKNNFGGYHKDFLESGNPGIIIENFVQDVASNSRADVKTTAQFGKIISFYRNKMSHLKSEKPEIAKIFSMVDENYRKLEEAQSEEKASEELSKHAPWNEGSDD